MPHLRALDLSRNEVNATSAKAIHDYLREPTCLLTKFSLAYADVDDEECTALVAALKGNKCLTDLNLSNKCVCAHDLCMCIRADVSFATFIDIRTPMQTMNT